MKEKPRGKGLKLAWVLNPRGPRHVSRFRGTSFNRFNFVLPDSDPDILYVILKDFRDTDTTAKSVSSNSSSKNSNPTKYANPGKPKIPSHNIVVETRDLFSN